MKPVRLFGRLIRNSSRPGNIILDTFGGSGTTIVACEQLGRKARLMELDPHYCDVIIARWEKLTGQKAIKLNPFNKQGTMTVEEIKAKHQPRQLENQVEFDAIMSDINQQQGELNRPLIDRKMEIVKQRELLNIQKQAINQQLSALSAEYQDIEAKAKAINRPLHDLKHEWITLNPRERFIKPKEDNV